MPASSESSPAVLTALESAGAVILGRAPASVSFGALIASDVLSILERWQLSVVSLSHTRAVVERDGRVDLRLLTHSTASDIAVSIARTALGRAGSRAAHPSARNRTLPVPLTGGDRHSEAALVAVLAAGHLDQQMFALRLEADSAREHTLAVLLLDATHLDPSTPLRDGIAYALALAATGDLLEAARLLST